MSTRKTDFRRQLLLASALLNSAAATYGETADATYSPYANVDFPTNLYWGDTHVHTNLSADAYSFGNHLTPEHAYRFARGEQVRSNTDQPVKLSRPLDFLVVTDHGEYLGVTALLDSAPEKLANSAMGQRWLRFKNNNKKHEILMDTPRIASGELTMSHDATVSRSVWDQVTATADRYNDPGRFTTLIGYEWTSLPNGNNLHRNVLFRDGADRVGQILPFTALDSANPEDLWAFLADYEEDTGGRALAIPHNANVSNGLMFSDRTFAGEPLTRAYAETRARWEPVVEVTQMKGDGEAHPYLSPQDPFADFENWDDGNFAQPKDAKENWMLQYEYARPALKNGLAMEAALGANPFKFGMIGSSDTHTALSAVEENNYFGKFGINEPNASRIDDTRMSAATYVASGYAAVWARDNTREALFDALQRREVYATTGSRISVRFFGGWHFDELDARRPNYAAIGYAKGVPMGGDLSRAPDGVSPRFLVVAGKDPRGANLDRVQIVKGWLDSDGVTREKVYNVAASGHRLDAAGAVTAVTSTVDTETASYTNSVGSPLLATVWQDPDFHADQRAFYYVRVLEIPTPRWTTRDAVFYGSPLPENVPAAIQERAYTSPIWYTP